MQIKINGKEYEARGGEMIYDVAKRNGIKIPTLCSTGEFHEGVCRICVVEMGGRLVTSCNTEVGEGMEIQTETENVSKARRINLELLWADHAGKCAGCDKNRMCRLQELAEEYRIENFHFVPRKGEMTSKEELDLVRDNWSRVVVEKENPCIVRNTEFCIECRKCVNICPENKFSVGHRAGDVVVGTPYGKVLDCSFCGKCLEVCPTGALVDKNDYARIMDDLDDLKIFSVAVVDLGMEEKIFKAAEKILSEKKLDAVLSSLGFERIIRLEEGEDIDEKVKEMKTVRAKKEKINPEDMKVFFISSKIAKKAEKNRYLDYVLSEREVARLTRDKEKIAAGKIKW